MKIIPVIDLKDGVVVHAQQGMRENYQPIKTDLCPSSDIYNVINAFLAIYHFDTIFEVGPVNYFPRLFKMRVKKKHRDTNPSTPEEAALKNIARRDKRNSRPPEQKFEENAARRAQRDARPPDQKAEENAARRAKRAACPLRVAIENRARWEKYSQSGHRSC